MTQAKTYKTASAFRTALSERISKEAKARKIEAQRLSRQVAFDRLLARIFSEPSAPFVLKGGYAMQLRVERARGTKDVDLALRDAKLLSAEPKNQNEAISEYLSGVAKKDIGDFFSFVISAPIMDLDAAPYGGARFHVEARLDGRSFEKFLLDIGVGDVWIEPLVMLESQAWLDFAGIRSAAFLAISGEQQFAEKIHAYTLPRGEGVVNSRVKDLVDMVLLISSGTLDDERTRSAIRETFKRRATHEFNPSLAPPSATWNDRFAALAQECDIPTDIASGFKLAQDFLIRLYP